MSNKQLSGKERGTGQKANRKERRMGVLESSETKAGRGKIRVREV